MNAILKYTSLQTAKSSIENMINPGKWSIILGDDMKYWVVTNRDASNLMKQGYMICLY